MFDKKRYFHSYYSLTLPREAVTGETVTDIRGNYKYKFVPDSHGKLSSVVITYILGYVIMLVKRFTNDKTLCFHIDKKLPCRIKEPKQYLYGLVEQNKYEIVRQPLSLAKQWDIHNMSKYCTNIDDATREYLYPKPSKPEESATPEGKEEEGNDSLLDNVTTEFGWLRSEISTKEWDEFIEVFRS
jgi:hypothetical protein